MIVSVVVYARIFQQIAKLQKAPFFIPNLVIFTFFLLLLQRFLGQSGVNLPGFKVQKAKIELKNNGRFEEIGLTESQRILFEMMRFWNGFVDSKDGHLVNSVIELLGLVEYKSFSVTEKIIYEQIIFLTTGQISNIYYEKASNLRQSDVLLFSDFDCVILKKKQDNLTKLYSLVLLEESSFHFQTYYNNVLCFKLIASQLQFLQSYYYNSIFYHKQLIKFVEIFNLDKQISKSSQQMLRRNNIDDNSVLVDFQIVISTDVVIQSKADFSSVYKLEEKQSFNLYKLTAQYNNTQQKETINIWRNLYILLGMLLAGFITVFILKYFFDTKQKLNILLLQPQSLVDVFVNKQFDLNLTDQSFLTQQYYNFINKKRRFLDTMEIIYPLNIIIHGNFAIQALSNEQFNFQLKNYQNVGQFFVKNFINQISQDQDNKLVLYYNLAKKVTNLVAFNILLFMSAILLWLCTFSFSKVKSIYQLGQYLVSDSKIDQKENIRDKYRLISFSSILGFILCLLSLVFILSFNIDKLETIQTKKKPQFLKKPDQYYTNDMKQFSTIIDSILQLNNINITLYSNIEQFEKEKVQQYMYQVNVIIKQVYTEGVLAFFSNQGQESPLLVTTCYMQQILSDIQKWMDLNKTPDLFQNLNQIKQSQFKCQTHYLVKNGVSSYFQQIKNISSMQLLNPGDNQLWLSISLQAIYISIQNYIKENDLLKHHYTKYFESEQIYSLVAVILLALLIKSTNKSKLIFICFSMVIIFLEILFHNLQQALPNYTNIAQYMVNSLEDLSIFSNLQYDLYPSELVSLLSVSKIVNNLNLLEEPYQSIKCQIFQRISQQNLSIGQQKVDFYLDKLGQQFCAQQKILQTEEILYTLKNNFDQQMIKLININDKLTSNYKQTVMLHFILCSLFIIVLITYGIFSLGGFTKSSIKKHFFSKLKLLLVYPILFLCLIFLSMFLDRFSAHQQNENYDLKIKQKTLVINFNFAKVLLSNIDMQKDSVQYLQFQDTKYNFADLESLSDVCFDEKNIFTNKNCNKNSTIQTLFQEEFSVLQKEFQQIYPGNLINQSICVKQNTLLERIQEIISLSEKQNNISFENIIQRQILISFLDFFIGLIGFAGLFHLVFRSKQYYDDYLSAIDTIIKHKGQITQEESQFIQLFLK